MKYPRITLCLFAILLLCAPARMIAQNYTQYVNPLVGTGAHGHTFPGALVPFGAVQLSPDTRLTGWDGCSGYHYDDNVVYGFSHTHLSGTGCSDYGDILVMPFSGKGSPVNTRYCSKFSHQRETASPGYYAVQLDGPNVFAEMTTTVHVGCHRYTFANDGQPHGIVIDLGHRDIVVDSYLEVIDSKEITGYRVSNAWSENQHVYFCMKLSQPATKVLFFRDSTLLNNNDHVQGGNLKALVYFADDVNQVCLNVGISAVDIDGARANLAEAPTFNFDLYRQRANDVWNKELGKIEVKGDENDMRIFYTALYHCFTSPYEFSDLDGRYRGQDGKVHRGDGHKVYTVFSLWDTYRALHPLINLTDTAMSRNIAYTLHAHYERSPHLMLPVWSHHGGENWCMIGYHGVSVMVDAALNTLQPDTEQELMELETMEAILSTTNVDYYDFTGLYKELGYVPFDKSRNGTSVTLENAYEDWCVYWALENHLEHTLPDVIGYEDSVRENYRQRALSYRNVYKDGFVRARYSDGSWKTPYSLLSTSGEGLIEGNAWNYSFYVPHDVNGMMQMMGGEKAFVRKLDTLFTMHVPDEFFAETEDVTREGMLGGYVHGNEPSHHIPYLYMWTTQPWKTQYWVREVMNKMYRNHIDGLCGNDDCGQMSAWYIFSAMGFYPVCPASGQYVIGAPYLPYMKVRMGSGKYLEIKAPNVSDKNRYIQRVLWNGKPYDKCYVTYRQLMEGGTLEFQMGPKPNKRLFQAKDTKPYSLTK